MILEGLYTTKIRGKKYPVRASWTPDYVYISGTIMKKLMTESVGISGWCHGFCIGWYRPKRDKGSNSGS